MMVTLKFNKLLLRPSLQTDQHCVRSTY